MSELTQGEGVGGTRLPRAYVADIPKGTTFQLVAAWLLMTEGALALIFLPVLTFTSDVDIPPGDLAMFGGLGVAAIVGGALLYTRRRWSWWVAFAVAIAVPAVLASDKGLTSWTEVYIAAAFGGVVVVFLVLGRRAAGNPNAMALASSQIPFRLKVALVWITIFLLLGLLFWLAGFDLDWMLDNLAYIAGGLQYTIYLAIGAIILAVLLALVGALARLSKNPVAYGVSGFYVSFFRGTPLIVQLFLIYLALPQIALNLESRSLLDVLKLTAFQVGVLGLGLNYGAYMTEIFRAGIQSVGHGQTEAADALGMTYWQRTRRVILPQATRVIIPPTGNDFIAMMKDTALVALIGSELARAELFRRATIAGNADLRRLESLLVAAAMYWGLTVIFSYFQARLERRMSKGYVRAGEAGTKKTARKTFLPTPQAQPGVIPTPGTELVPPAGGAEEVPT